MANQVSSNVGQVVLRSNPETGKHEKFVLPVFIDIFLAIRKGVDESEILKKYRETGYAKYKNKLPQFTFSCPVYVKDGVLLKENNTLGPLFQLDIDIENNDEAKKLDEQVLDRKEELGIMLYAKSAGGKGRHIVALRYPGTTNLENQVRLSIALHVEFDNQAHDAHRVLYQTGLDDLLYLNEDIFKCIPPEEEAEANKQ